MPLSILSLTLAGSVVLGLLLGAEALFPTLWSCRWRYLARIAVLPVFVVPLTAPASLLRQPTSALLLDWEPSLQMLQAPNITPISTSSLLPSYSTLATVIWLMGVVLFLLRRLILWVRFCKGMRRAAIPASPFESALLSHCAQALGIRQHVQLMVCTGIGTPVLMGIFRPIILLPHSNLPVSELESIFRHELIHLHRCDTTCKLVAQIVNAVHWFNPVAWLLSKQIGEQCELSCDEAVVRNMNITQRHQYALAILNQMEIACKNPPYTVSSFASTKQILQKRLRNIMNIQKKDSNRLFASTVVGVILFATCITTAFAFSPVGASHSAVTSSKTEAPLVTFNCPIPDTAAYRQVSLAFGEYDHTGTDIVAPDGTSILASADGTVVYAQLDGDSPYGNYLVLEHNGDYKSLYGHCDKLLVTVGDAVKQGQTIATVGATGWSTGPHLHFEIRKDAEAVDSEQYIEIKAITPTK